MATFKDLMRCLKYVTVCDSETQHDEYGEPNIKCVNCKLSRVCTMFSKVALNIFPSRNIEEEIDEWIKEHPIKTRLSEFKKLYPNSTLADDSYPINIFPCDLDYTYKDKNCNNNCLVCGEKYWNEEID